MRFPPKINASVSSPHHNIPLQTAPLVCVSLRSLLQDRTLETRRDRLERYERELTTVNNDHWHGHGLGISRMLKCKRHPIWWHRARWSRVPYPAIAMIHAEAHSMPTDTWTQRDRETETWSKRDRGNGCNKTEPDGFVLKW